LYNIAVNRNTPIPLLIKLIGNEGYGVRLAVARNPSLPRKDKIDYLGRAAQSRDSNELGFAAEDPDTPVDVLQQLSSSEVPWLRRAAMENLAKRKPTNERQ